MYQEAVFHNYSAVLNNPQTEAEMEFAQQVFDISAEINEEAQREHEAVELKFWQMKLEKIQELYEQLVA